MKKIKITVSFLLIICICAAFGAVASYALAPVSGSGGTVTDAASLVEALGGEDAAWINDAGAVCLRADVTLAGQIVISGGELQLNGASCIISRGFESGAMFLIEGGTLTLGSPNGKDRDETLILDGCSDAFGSYEGVFVISAGTLNINAGTLIENSHADIGGAITVSGGECVMAGGLVTDCSAEDGGGAYISGGSFTMSGGQIKSCAANRNGGGVYVAGGSFGMDSGTVGGAVSYEEYSTEPIIGSEDGCTAQSGGGIYFDGGECYINGGTVACNTADNGGGVYVSPKTELLLASGEISYNNANDGGGIYNSGLTVNAYCRVAYNTAVTGGGVYNISGGEKGFSLQGADINTNKADYAAGVYNADGALFTMTGGAINYNEAAVYGGGLINYGGFTLEAGSLGYNKLTNEIKVAVDALNIGTLTFTNEVFIGGSGDIALGSVEGSGDNSAVVLAGPFTCTTKIARLLPVTVSADGTLTPDYTKGRVLAVTEDEDGEKSGMKYYSTLFDVPEDGTGGAWIMDKAGTLQKEPLSIWFWLTCAAIAVVIAGAAVYVVRLNKSDRKK